MRRFFVVALAGGWAAVAFASWGSAQSLEEALVMGYRSNPTLLAERAALRALDEDRAVAVAFALPNVSLLGSYGASESDSSPPPMDARDGSRSLRPALARLQVRQPLYQGGRRRSGLMQAEANIEAGRARLEGVEQQVLLGIITNYVDVTTARAVVALGRNQTVLLERQLQAVESRFAVGESTGTEVAQAEARLALARSSLARSEGDLAVALAEYARVVGSPAESLEATPLPISLASPLLPAGLEEALALAVSHAPGLRAARASERAAGYGVTVARGGLRPQVDVSGQVQYGDSLAVDGQSQEEFSLTAQVTMPLYQGGGGVSQVRRALALESAARLSRVAEERRLAAAVRAAWEGLEAARARIVSDERQVAANEIAFEGLARENQAGLRTILELLDGEQELFNARVALTRSRRDAYVAGYALLAAMGRMGAANLGLPVALYAPEAGGGGVGGWFGYGRIAPEGADE